MTVPTEQALHDKLSDLFSDISEIPPLPSATQRILEVVENPLSSAYELADIISKDPSLTAQILKAANSAFYGFPNRIGTIYLATVILGFSTVRTIALGVCVLKLFRDHDQETSAIDPTRFWAHSLKCAVACKLLATRYKYYVVGEAFTTGILHDLGRFVLGHYAASRYRQVQQLHRDQQIPMLKAEAQIFGFTHCDVGSYLLERWRLPISIIDAVQFHHDPLSARHAPDLASIVHVAEHLSHLHSYRLGQEREDPGVGPHDWGTLPIPTHEEGAIEALMVDLDTELNKADSFLRILKGEDVPEDELKPTSNAS